MIQLDEYNIYQGDTGVILNVRPSVLDDGVAIDNDWTCYIAVTDSSNNEVIASRAVTDKTAGDLRFIAALTPTETESLAVVDNAETRYIQVIEVTNTTVIPPFKMEVHVVLNVHPQGIPA